MKRVLVGFFAVALAVMPALGSAQTSTNPSALTAQIQALLAQIKSLNDQISALQQQKQQVVASILTTMREGTEGDKVTILQALLAADPEIYPEGLITGFYGRLTASAVRRFQAKNGLEQVGFVGPRTLKLLNELQGRVQLAFEDDDDEDEDRDDEDNDDDRDENKAAEKLQKAMRKDAKDVAQAVKKIRKICAKVPPGHLIAPGWLRKNDLPLVPLCQTLPPGIIKQTSSTTSLPPPPAGCYYQQVWCITTPCNPILVCPSSTSTTDITAPTLSNVSASVSHDGATVSWSTNELSDTQIAFGTSTAYGSLSALISTLTTNHIQQLTGLLPSTTYHYQARSKDFAGNLGVSGDQMFNTLAAPDTTAPVISSVVVTPASTSATVAWNTNEAANSKVYYSPVSPVDPVASGTLSVADATLVTSHTLTLLSLNASTTYHFMVESADAAGNKATSTGSFVTTP